MGGFTPPVSVTVDPADGVLFLDDLHVPGDMRSPLTEATRLAMDAERRVRDLRAMLTQERSGDGRRDNRSRSTREDRALQDEMKKALDALADARRRLTDVQRRMMERDAGRSGGRRPIPSRPYVLSIPERGRNLRPGTVQVHPQIAPFAVHQPNVDLGEVGKRRVTLNREDANPREAILDLLKQTDANYVIRGVDEGVVREKRADPASPGGSPTGSDLENRRDSLFGRLSVSFHFNNVTLEEALGAVAEAAGLQYTVRGNIILLSPGRTLFPAEARTFFTVPDERRRFQRRGPATRPVPAKPSKAPAVLREAPAAPPAPEAPVLLTTPAFPTEEVR